MFISEMSSLASYWQPFCLYSSPSAVSIASYQESLNQSNCWKPSFSSEIILNRIGIYYT